MPDYKEMYLIMARAAEKAERILIEAQRKCEELYLSAGDEPAGESGEKTDEEQAAGQGARCAL